MFFQLWHHQHRDQLPQPATLRNVLCGKASYANVSGTVRFNGVEGRSNWVQLSNMADDFNPDGTAGWKMMLIFLWGLLTNSLPGNYEEYKTVMGFVPQDDIVHEAGFDILSVSVSFPGGGRKWGHDATTASCPNMGLLKKIRIFVIFSRDTGYPCLFGCKSRGTTKL